MPTLVILSHSGCFRISSIISDISSAVVFLDLVVIIHPFRPLSIGHFIISESPSRLVGISSFGSLPPES
jgi:hypothetical protein